MELTEQAELFPAPQQLRPALSPWPPPADGLDADLAEARLPIGNARAPSTTAKYLRAWPLFVRWVGAHAPDYDAFPSHPALIGLYIGAMLQRGESRSWILGKLSAIAYAHELVGLPRPWLLHPELEREIDGLRRDYKVDNNNRHTREGLMHDEAVTLLARLPPATTLLARRDRAVFALTWLSAQRRSTIAALTVRDVRFDRDVKSGKRYLELYIAHSKTDRAGHGKHVVITEIPETNPLAPLCAVRAVTAWLDGAQIRAEVDSALFRSFPGGKAMSARGIGAGDVATIVKRLCGQSGLVDPASYAAHSLRRGFAASADTLGIPRSVAMEHGGWRDPATYDRYARSGAVRFNATSMLWEAVAKNVDDAKQSTR